MNTENRRRSPRANQEMFVSVTALPPFKAGVKKATVQLVSQDISVHGIRFRTPDFLPLDTAVRVDLKLEDKSAPLSILGEVRRVRELPNLHMHEVGVEFHSLAPETRQQLARFVDRHTA